MIDSGTTASVEGSSLEASTTSADAVGINLFSCAITVLVVVDFEYNAMLRCGWYESSLPYKLLLVELASVAPATTFARMMNSEKEATISSVLNLKV